MEAPVIADTVSHYTVLKKLGAGGMGDVYLAEDTVLNRRVAVKFLPEDSAADQRARRHLIQEAQAAAKLDHPNICTIHEVGEEAGRGFIVMEYVEGETLASRMRRKPLALRESLDIAVQVADALAEAHSHGISHRDITPQNIMLTARQHVKVIDFGLAKVIRDRSRVDSEAVTESLLTDTGVIVGTVNYMSPEQVRGKSLDARTDIFSLGVVLYEMITGHQAFAAESTAMTISAIVSRKPAPLTQYSKSVPVELRRIVTKALQKDRHERYQTIRDLLLDLRSLKHHLDFAKEFEHSLPIDTGNGQLAWPLAAASLGTEIERHKRALTISAAIVVLVILTLVYLFYVPAKTAAIDSIAVLPLVNASNDPDTEYLSDGITESLINSLSQVQELRVVARATAFRYKDKEIDTQKIGRELGVQAILTGKVIQQGETLAIQVELVETSRGSQVWGEHYDRKASELLPARQELARDITERLRLRLRGEDEKRLTRGDASNSEAYQFYLRGRHFWNSRTAARLNKAIEQFQQAIALDSNYALAYVGLADSYIMLEAYAGSPASEVQPKARAAVKQALQLDDSLADAHASLGLIQQFTWNFGEAEREYKRAIELNPNCATAYFYYGFYLHEVRGQFDAAMAEIRRAQRLDPLSPRISNEITGIHASKGELDATQEAAKKVMELDPNFSGAHRMLGAVYLRQRRYDEANGEFKKAVELSGRATWDVAGLGVYYAMAGDRAGARAILKELEEKYDSGEMFGQPIAYVYAALGDKQQAFAWLERDFQARSGLLPLIAHATEAEILRDQLSSDPRWNDLLRRIGLPQN